MAQPKQELTPDRVRSAVRHFLELAAAFEGSGVEVVSAGSGGAGASLEDPDAMKCLEKTVARLERHEAVQRQHQRKAFAASLHDDVKALFADLTTTPDTVDLPGRVQELAHSRGFVAGEKLLDALVIPRHEVKGGASATAARQLGELAQKVTERTLFTYVSDRGALPLWRVVWGRWVPRGLCMKYVATALAPVGGSPPELELDAPGDAVFRQIDEHAEAEYRKQVVETYEYVFFGQLESVDDSERAAALEAIRGLRLRLSELARAEVEAARADRSDPPGNGDMERAVEQRMREMARELTAENLRQAGID